MVLCVRIQLEVWMTIIVESAWVESMGAASGRG